MGEKKYDLSISHAYGYKDSFLNELALALQQEGARIWYTGFDLKAGDSIAESVNRALNESRYGILIISAAYLEKQWAMIELDSLLATDRKGKIIPVLHNIAVKQWAKLVPAFKCKLSISSTQGIGQVVNCILKKLKEDTLPALKRKKSVTAGKARTAVKKIIAPAGIIVLGGNTSSKNMIGNEMPIRKKKARITEW